MASKSKPRPSEGSFWISYSDLATSLMLVFVLIVCITSIKMQKELTKQQDKLIEVGKEVRDLLGRRDELSTRLSVAVDDANQEIGQPIFKYLEGEVSVSENDVAWFESGKADLTPAGQAHVAVFYRHLYRRLLGDGRTLPDFLSAINIQGHTDPWPRTGGGTLWSWESYNGSAQREHQDGNLWLSQQRGKAILDYIQTLYATGVVKEEEIPWRPFIAVAQVTGRAWTRAFCQAEDAAPSPISASALLADDPCPATPVAPNAALNRSSRRVTFSFDLDDKVILERLQRVLDDAVPAAEPP